jgi:hypothetical protein
VVPLGREVSVGTIKVVYRWILDGSSIEGEQEETIGEDGKCVLPRMPPGVLALEEFDTKVPVLWSYTAVDFYEKTRNWAWGYNLTDQRRVPFRNGDVVTIWFGPAAVDGNLRVYGFSQGKLAPLTESCVLKPAQEEGTPPHVVRMVGDKITIELKDDAKLVEKDDHYFLRHCLQNNEFWRSTTATPRIIEVDKQGACFWAVAIYEPGPRPKQEKKKKSGKPGTTVRPRGGNRRGTPSEE